MRNDRLRDSKPIHPDTGAVPLHITFRAPSSEDGRRVWELVAACPPLDQNSLYCNLVQCTDFSGTCVLAERDGQTVGWVSGYRQPDDHETLFIWQVAVHDKARGLGLARKMIKAILSRPAAHGVTRIKTTITPENDASWSLFRSVARDLTAPFDSEVWFEKDQHFGGEHETEHMITIGPFGGDTGIMSRQDHTSKLHQTEAS